MIQPARDRYEILNPGTDFTVNLLTLASPVLKRKLLPTAYDTGEISSSYARLDFSESSLQVLIREQQRTPRGREECRGT